MVTERWVVAAHPDDELLGLGQLVRDRKLACVLYPSSSWNVARRKEALALAQQSEYRVEFNLKTLDSAPRGAQVFVPSPLDTHPDHQRVLSEVAPLLAARRDFEVREYKVGGGAPYSEAVTDEHFDWKVRTFRLFYESQVDVLTDPSFFLFEGSAQLGPADLFVTFDEVGFHAWPDAPDVVGYLKHPHRHLFRVRLGLLGLYCQDREEEFHLVQAWARTRFKEIVQDGGSCEVMARALALQARARFGCSCEAEVWEDQECGARVRV